MRHQIHFGLAAGAALCTSAAAQMNCPPDPADYECTSQGLQDYLDDYEDCLCMPNPGCSMTFSEYLGAITAWRAECDGTGTIDWCTQVLAAVGNTNLDNCEKNALLVRSGCAPVYDCDPDDGNDDGGPGLFPVPPYPPPTDPWPRDGYDPSGPGDWVPMFGPSDNGINLARGTYEPRIVDIELPAPGFTWVVGRSYSATQYDSSGSHVNSNGYQGYNWIQTSQPEFYFTAPSDSEDFGQVRIRFDGTTLLTFIETGPGSKVYEGLGSTSGMVTFNEDGSGIDTYTFYTRTGRKFIFFGDDTPDSDKDFQLWKIVDAAGNTAWVGHPTDKDDAAADGYDSDGRILVAVDSADRRYSYTYSTSTIGGSKRLEEVLVEKKDGGEWYGTPTNPTEVARVEYDFYTMTETDGNGEGKGLAGDLKLVTVVMPTSEDDMSGDITVDYKTHYRYYTLVWDDDPENLGHQHALRYVYGPEGTRNFDWGEDGGEIPPVMDDGFLSADNDDLRSFAEWFFEYEKDDPANDFHRRITETYYAGDCGCGGNSNGVTTLAYEENSFGLDGKFDYDVEGWAMRTIIARGDGTYETLAFDVQPRPVARIVTEGNPSTTPGDTWVTQMIRNDHGDMTEERTPASITAYTHSTGAITASASVGLINEYTYLYSEHLEGYVQDMKWKEGTGGSAYLSDTVEYLVQELDVEGSGEKIGRPFTEHRWNYDEETTTAARDDAMSNPSGSRQTTYSYQFHDHASRDTTSIDHITPKRITVTVPKVATGNNGRGDGGSDPAIEAKAYLRKDGTTAFTQAPAYDNAATADLVHAYFLHENGQVKKIIHDCQTNSGSDFASGDDPFTNFGITESSSGLRQITESTYDDQGRVDTVTLFAHSMSDDRETKTYYTRLADGQIVTLSIPKVSGSTSYGPVQMVVLNHARNVTAEAVIAVDGGTTMASFADWIDEADSNPLDAVDHADLELARVTTILHDEVGARAEEERTYFEIPATWPGNATSNYDPMLYEHDDMGRVVAVEDATGTIDRTVYDAQGRPIERWVGTDDTGFPGSGNMVKVHAFEFDGNADGGNGYLTKHTLDPGGSARVTSYEYDARGRQLLQSNPASPDYILRKFDNRGREVASAYYVHDAGGAGGVVDEDDDPTTRTEDRLSLSQVFYDEVGRVWKRQVHKIDVTDGSDDDNLQELTWYDAESRTVKVDGVRLMKRSYDRIGRLTHEFDLAADNDTTYAHAQDVSGDVVLEESQTLYDDATGYIILSAAIDREHDDFGASETTGALDSNADGEDLEFAAANLSGRIQITGLWHDDLGRVTTVGFYGTNGGSDYAYSTTAPSSSSGSVLVSKYAYDGEGAVETVTDAAGNVTRHEYDDAGREVKIIGNYDDGTPGGTNGDEDQVIVYAYTDGLMTSMKADLPANDQETTYTYGISTTDSPGPSEFNANNVLRKVVYPDLKIGETEADRRELYAYNVVGEQDWMTDQLGVTFDTVFDDLGRETSVKLAVTGTDLDTSVLRIDTAYDSLGRVSTVTQYDAATAGNVVDQVKYSYDSWNNISKFEQDHDSTVGGSLLYDVDYTFVKWTGGRNAVRMSAMDLPDATTVAYQYLNVVGSLGGDGAASRVSRVAISLSAIAVYDYLGADTVVGIDLPEPDVFSNLYGGSGYTGLDRFNRVENQTWTKDLTTDVDFYDVTMAFDYNSNVTSILDAIHTDASSGAGLFDYRYDMDGLDRLAEVGRGDWDGTSLTNDQEGEVWTLDLVGNWSLHQLDITGDGDYIDSGELNDDRTHNKANELTARDTDDDSTNDFTLVYDKVGNLTDDGEQHEYVYDPFGRLRKVVNRSTSNSLAEFTYNGLGYRTTAVYDTDSDGSLGDETTLHLVYDVEWRIVAIYEGSDSDPVEQFVYHNAGADGMGYASPLDATILRDRDTTGNGTLDERVYYCHNWRSDVVALVTDAGEQLEQVRYSPYGVPFGLPAGDVNGDGKADVADVIQISAWVMSGYDVRGDLNLDGTVDAADITAFTNGPSGENLGRGEASRTDVENSKTYAGYEWDDQLGGLGATFYHVRHRVFYSELGRWTRRDPLGYVDGANLYQYVQSRPIVSIDPHGLDQTITVPCGGDCGPVAPPIAQPGRPKRVPPPWRPDNEFLPDDVPFDEALCVKLELNKPQNRNRYCATRRCCAQYVNDVHHACKAKSAKERRKRMARANRRLRKCNQRVWRQTVGAQCWANCYNLLSGACLTQYNACMTIFGFVTPFSIANCLRKATSIRDALACFWEKPLIALTVCTYRYAGCMQRALIECHFLCR